MGRHSAPDDDVDDGALANGESGLALLDLDDADVGEGDAAATTPRGRHSWSGAADVGLLNRTGPIERVTDLPPAAAAEAPLVRPPSGTRADLALLRTSPGLRWRAAAAVVVPIAIYAIVLAVIGKLDRFVYWVWIPIVVAGVLFGLMLDLAARNTNNPGADGS